MRFRERPSANFTDAISEKKQRTLRSHRGIELPHGAGRGVARVDERLLSRRELARVEPLEVLARHIDFAAHFQNFRWLFSAQPPRNRANRVNVVRDVLTDFAVAARRRNCKATRFVAQTDCEAVELELRNVLDWLRTDGKT